MPFEAAYQPRSQCRESCEPNRPTGPVLTVCVFLEHHEVVFRAAFRITGNASGAEDVLQTLVIGNDSPLFSY
jgi:hypothetical protein